MNEADWLSSDDPSELLHSAEVGKISDRKLRLFACACMRLELARMRPEAVRFIEGGERRADGEKVRIGRFSGQASVLEYLAVEVAELIPDVDIPIIQQVGRLLTYRELQANRPAQASLFREIRGNPWRPVPALWKLCPWCAGDGQGSHEKDKEEYPCPVCKGRGRVVDSPWLTPTVLALATAAYDNRAGRKCEPCKGTGKVRYSDLEDEEPDCVCPDCYGKGVIEDGTLDPFRLSLLADALEEGGCDSADLLSHLHSAGKHVKGCWAVDLLLGKS